MPIKSAQFQAVTSAQNFAFIPLNIHQPDFKVTWAVVKTGSGDATYAVQGTLDNIQDSSVSANVFDIVSGQTASNDGSITTPMQAVRLRITAVSASSDVSFRVLQSGI